MDSRLFSASLWRCDDDNYTMKFVLYNSREAGLDSQLRSWFLMPDRTTSVLSHSGQITRGNWHCTFDTTITAYFDPPGSDMLFQLLDHTECYQCIPHRHLVLIPASYQCRPEEVGTPHARFHINTFKWLTFPHLYSMTFRVFDMQVPPEFPLEAWTFSPDGVIRCSRSMTVTIGNGGWRRTNTPMNVCIEVDIGRPMQDGTLSSPRQLSFYLLSDSGAFVAPNTPELLLLPWFEATMPGPTVRSQAISRIAAQ